jgi:superfamily II DNA or RNA helicase
MRIRCSEEADGIAYVSAEPEDVPYERWAIEIEAPQRRAVAILASLESDSSAVVRETAILVSHKSIARLGSTEAHQLNLPTEIPYDLDIRLEGTIDEESCRFRARWVSQGGKPEVGVTRIGAIAKRGSQQYRVPDPFYSIVCELDAFNESPPSSRDERLLAWGRIQECIGGDPSISLEGYLSGMRVFRASSFTLRIDNDDRGDVTLAPVLLRSREPIGMQEPLPGLSEDDDRPQELLPPAYQRVFEARFDQFEDARSCYPVESGYYVVVDEPLRKALTTVKTVRNAEPEARREFARNPRAFIREVLEGEVTDDLLEGLFSETESYSERVTGLGLWQPKSLPWLIQAGQSWLPPELEIFKATTTPSDSAIVELQQVREQLSAAITRGEASIKVLGCDVPATQESLDALEEILQKCKETKAASPSPKQKSVLLIEDNLEALGYASKQVERRASSFSIPAISSTLKPHQIECLKWLEDQWRTGCSGAILADDMGLGKTLEALTFFKWLQEEMAAGHWPRQPLLVVAPTGLLKNWEEEAERHLGPAGLGTLQRAYGSGLKALRRPGSRSLDREPLRHADWILTTYETLRDYQHEFALVRFSAIVFDEAQKIKNPAILLTEACKAMRADFTLAMTGTPVENRLADLWCIADAARPGALGGLRDFVKKYEPGETTALEELRERVLNPIESFPAMMLRRMKADKLPGLPAKHEHVTERAMPELQARAYSQRLSTIDKERPGWMLETLHAIRSVSLHPNPDSDANDEDFVALSARFAITFEILDSIDKSGEKALVFIEFKSIQAQLASLIQRRYDLDALPMIINGDVSGPGRQERVRRFQTHPDFDVLILSPKAGGVGLTLTAANHVIHLSRWWNPAVEDQCTDRVYRIGQGRTVHVHYPLAIHPGHPDATFDKLLHGLIERKRAKSRNLLTPPAADESELRDLLEQSVNAVGAEANF